MSVINTNVLALNSQNNLAKSQGALGSAIERLSSGMRINSAKDDAAGQAIANRFTANIKGLTQATRNANDGISIAQTTEGSLNEINNNLQRIRELSVQAANGSNSADDRKSIQAEIRQRLDEIDRVSEQTQFNGVQVLGRGAGDLSVQVGAHDNQTIKIQLKEISSESLKLSGYSVAGPRGDLTTNTLAGNKDQVGSLKNVFGESTSLTGASVTNSTGIQSQVQKVFDQADMDKKLGDKFTVAADSHISLVIDEGGNWFSKVKVTIKGDADAAKLATDLGFRTNPESAPDTALATNGTFDIYIAVDPNVDGRKTDGSLDAGGTGNAYLQIKSDTTFSMQDLQAGIPTADPLKKLDVALQQVDDLRSHLGAIQNRFESTITNLNNTVTNLSASRSRIEDADYAVEVSNMTRAQILQQAGTSVLAQANQVPQSVLSLLG